MTLTSDIFIFGIASGALVAIGAVGFTLQYGITNVLNLAFGQIITSSIYVTFLVAKFHSNLALLLVVGAIWGALFSALLNTSIIQPFTRRGSGLVGVAIVTVGLGLIIENALQAIQGPRILTYVSPSSTPIRVLSVTISSVQVLVVSLAVALMFLVYIVLHHTRVGLAMRAMAADPSLTRICGISTTRLRNVSWMLSGGLCGITGVLLGVAVGSFGPSVGDGLFLEIVAAAILGGIGEPYGAMLGGLVVGIVGEAAGALISPAYTSIAASIVLVGALIVRPQGLFGGLAATRKLTA